MKASPCTPGLTGPRGRTGTSSRPDRMAGLANCRWTRCSTGLNLGECRNLGTASSGPGPPVWPRSRCSSLRDGRRLLRAQRPGGRPLAHRLRVAAPDHLARRLGLRGLPDAGRLPGLSEPHSDARLHRVLRRRLRPAPARHLRHRGAPGRAGGPRRRGGWWVETSDGRRTRYDGVLVANGHLWDPNLPEIASSFTGTSLHSSAYRRPDDVKGERVLVVGAGNSGCDLAVDTATARRRPRSRCGVGRCSSRRRSSAARGPS